MIDLCNQEWREIEDDNTYVLSKLRPWMFGLPSFYVANLGKKKYEEKIIDENIQSYLKENIAQK